MSQKKQLSILEFSRLTGIKRENLRFYDKIGLLSPESRGDNRYRYYSRRQLNTAYLIGSLRGLGVGLETIKEYSEQRTPEKMLSLFSTQDARIQAEVERLQEMRSIMALYSKMARDALSHEDGALFFVQKEQEPIFLCPAIPADMEYDEGEIFSYEYADSKGVHLGYPLGICLAQSVLESRVPGPLQYYFKAASHQNAWKPAGLYATLYARCDPWHSMPLYLRLLDFIRREHFCVSGDAYEEYLLSDIAVPELSQYCIRVEIPVCDDKKL